MHLCEETPSYLLVNVDWTNYRLQPNAADTTLSLKDFAAASVEVTEMSGFQKDDANTFAEPFKVAPRTYSAPAQAEMTWSFPPESMTILRFKHA